MKLESRASFVVTKLQSHGQPVEATDRPSMGRNRSCDPVLLFLVTQANRLKQKRKDDLLHVVNIILWLLRTG